MTFRRYAREELYDIAVALSRGLESKERVRSDHKHHAKLITREYVWTRNTVASTICAGASEYA